MTVGTLQLDTVDCLPPLRSEPLEAALHAVRGLAKAVSAHLLSFDRRDGQLSVIGGTNVDLRRLATPASRLVGETATAFLFGAVQPAWIAASDGVGATLLVKLTERERSSLLLVLEFRDATPVSRARVMKIVPDLVVLLVSHLNVETRAQVAEQQRAAALAALDQDDVGVIAVRADHSIVFANAAASEMLAGAIGLQIRRGVLRPANYVDTVQFQAALDIAAESSTSTRAERSRAFVMRLTPGERQSPTIAAITPASDKAGAILEGEAAAIIHLLSADARGGSAVEVLCQLHGLSRVETQLVVNLCAGLTVSEAATEMRVKVETARAYLKQVFGKTGTHRQTDLALLMDRYVRAVRGKFEFQLA